MKLHRRVAALLCIGLLTLTLSGPALAMDPEGGASGQTLIQVIWNWLVETLDGETDPDGAGLHIPPGCA